MATRTSKSSSARKSASAKTAAKPAAKSAAKSSSTAIPIQTGRLAMPDPAQFAKFAKVMTPEQAFELYKANAKIALEIINAAIENTAKVRKLQFEGEEKARSMQKKLFSLMEAQMQGVPGVKEARAAMAMLPDLTPAKDLVAAMQNVVTSGGSTFESMQRVMQDFAKSMPGMKR